MEIRAEVQGITVYDDFAHHPTAIKTTVEGLRAKVGSSRILAILEPRSNTMRMGVHAGLLGDALADADVALLFQSAQVEWDVRAATATHPRVAVFGQVGDIVDWIAREARSGDHVLIMSNGGFEGIHQRVESALQTRT
jgi:UDP-N-acetylmuramate: L-alanyl-gamma-D-glutamyl-meso-diaminopimelate ligase